MKKKTIYLIIILAIILSFWAMKFGSKMIAVNNVPLNSYTVKFSGQTPHKFYFSRGSRFSSYELLNKNTLTLKNLQPDSTYYYQIDNGKVHQLNTVDKTFEFNGILANAKNEVLVFDKKLNLLYRVQVQNLTDSEMFNGYLYVLTKNNMFVYKNDNKVFSINLNQTGKKLLKVNNNLYLLTQKSIFKINEFQTKLTLKNTFEISDFYPYQNSFLLYKNNSGIYFSKKKIFDIDNLSSMVVKGRYLFVSSYGGKVYIIDLRNFKTVYSKDLKFHIFNLFVDGNRLYLGGTGKLLIFNIKDFSKITLFKQIKTNFVFSKIVVLDNTLIGCEGDRGAVLINVKTGKTTYSFDNGIFAYDIAHLDKKYYITDPYQGIKIYNDDFKKINEFSIKGFVSIIYSTGKNIVIGVDKKLQIYDPNMNLISTIQLKEVPTSITGKYQYLFVSEHNTGFQIINIENPKKPIIAETILSGGSARNLTFKNGSVYLANGSNVKIYKINMVINYEQKSTIKVNGNAFDCVVNNNILYIDNLKRSISLYDISDPEKPRFIGVKKVGYSIVSMTFYKNYLICNGGFDGLYIYKNDGVSLKLYKKIKDGSYYNKAFVYGNKIVVLKGEYGFDVLDSSFSIQKKIDWVFLYSVKAF